jgi:hypothetical protein
VPEARKGRKFTIRFVDLNRFFIEYFRTEGGESVGQAEDDEEVQYEDSVDGTSSEENRNFTLAKVLSESGNEGDNFYSLSKGTFIVCIIDDNQL